MHGVTLFLLSLGFVAASKWTYQGAHGPAHWKHLVGFLDCAGTSQSPIDIDTTSTTYDPDLAALTFTDYSAEAKVELALTNNGHAAQCSVINFVGDHPRISGGGLPGTFKLAQFHFHWGVTDSTGSEHMLDGKQYPLEIHWVHYNDKYGHLGDAADKSDGLAVLGFFFEVSGGDNAEFEPIISELQNVIYTDGSAAIAGIGLDSLLGDTSAFYRYKGSLTTPGCHESVTWTVFKHPIKISAAQVAKFYSLMGKASADSDNHAIGFNYRPVQPLGGRKVYHSMAPSGAASIVISASLLCSLLMAAKFFV